MRRTALLLLMAALSACELREISLAEAEDRVVAEVVLRAGESQQTAFLQRTIGVTGIRSVPGAVIEVRDPTGRVMPFEPVPISRCLDSPDLDAASGSCYQSDPDAFIVRAGERYALRIELPDGGVITGETFVPADFEILRPGGPFCRLEPETTLDLMWAGSEGAWVYVSEVRLVGLAAALFEQGIELHQEPVRLLGLSISREDTTITFPSGFGLFDRADPDLADVLIAIRDGLPPGVVADLVVAAADRNYVNWARGGNFNPSGTVRVPSVGGDGTGVFGSLVPKGRVVTTSRMDPAPPCR